MRAAAAATAAAVAAAVAASGSDDGAAAASVRMRPGRVLGRDVGDGGVVACGGVGEGGCGDGSGGGDAAGGGLGGGGVRGVSGVAVLSVRCGARAGDDVQPGTDLAAVSLDKDSPAAASVDAGAKGENEAQQNECMVKMS